MQYKVVIARKNRRDKLIDIEAATIKEAKEKIRELYEDWEILDVMLASKFELLN
jgi:hypothetical protein